MDELADIMNMIVLFTITPATLCKCCALVAIEKVRAEHVLGCMRINLCNIIKFSLDFAAQRRRLLLRSSDAVFIGNRRRQFAVHFIQFGATFALEIG